MLFAYSQIRGKVMARLMRQISHSMWVLGTLSLLLSSGSHARDEDERLKQAYGGKGTTLYCKAPFSLRDRIRIDYIYSEKQMLQHFGCLTSRQCASKPAFTSAFEDLHNLYPIERKVALDRRGSTFDDSPDDEVAAGECGYRLSYLQFEPPDHAKGNVARALVYMAKRHDLPLPTTAALLKQWNDMDPPDEEEQRRNQAIQRIQGNSNPFIDNPSRLDGITGLRGRDW